MSTAEISILFIFTSFVVGVLITQTISYFHDAIPYTVVVFVFGALMAFFDYGDRTGLWSQSVGDWSYFDSEILFYFLLPPLILGDAMSLNWYYAVGGIWQSILLAGPGVFVGTALMGVLTKYILPYDWSWNLCFLFGAILSATDPVAVVALLKGCNASPKLTILIIGESLLNDGTAMVLFNLLFNILNGEAYTGGDIVVFFINSCLGSPAFGVACGLAMVYWMRTARRKYKEMDSIVQIAITISCGYLIFFMAQYIFLQSGVLALCGAGIVIAALAPPIILDQEAMHNVWETFGWFMNTILFLLVGLRLGLYIIYFAHAADYLYTFILYLVLMAIRIIMVVMFFPVISRIGHKCTVKEAIFISWSGLRGGVAIILALLVGTNTNPNISSEDSERLFFYVAGIAALTLFINGTLAETVLLRLGLIGDESIAKVAIANQMRQRVRGKMNKSCIDMENSMNISVEESSYLRSRCTILREYDDLKISDDTNNYSQLASITKSVSNVFSNIPRLLKHHLSGKDSTNTAMSPTKSDSSGQLHDSKHNEQSEYSPRTQDTSSRPTSARMNIKDDLGDSFGVKRTSSMQIDDYGKYASLSDRSEKPTSKKEHTHTPTHTPKVGGTILASASPSDTDDASGSGTPSKRLYYDMLLSASTREPGLRPRSNSSFMGVMGSLKGRISNILDPLAVLKADLGVSSPSLTPDADTANATGTLQDGITQEKSKSKPKIAGKRRSAKPSKKKPSKKVDLHDTVSFKTALTKTDHDALALTNPDNIHTESTSSRNCRIEKAALYSIIESRNESDKSEAFSTISGAQGNNDDDDIELALSRKNTTDQNNNMKKSEYTKDDDDDDDGDDDYESDYESDYDNIEYESNEEVKEDDKVDKVEPQEDETIWESRLRSLTTYISQKRHEEDSRNIIDGTSPPWSPELVGYYRTIFLSIVRTRYWKDIQQGRLPRYSHTSLFLLYSIDVGLDGALVPDTQDWAAIETELDTNKSYIWLLYWLGRCVNSSLILNSLLKIDANRIKSAVYLLTSFIAAHEYAQSKLHEYSSVSEDQRAHDSTIVSPEEAIVRDESIQAVKKARIRLSQFDSTMIADIRLRQATNQLLMHEAEVVEEMVQEGLLSEQNAEEFFEEIEGDMTEVEVDRKLLYNKLYKGRRRDLEIHTYADVADVYRVYTPVWGKWGKSLMIYPEETLRKRRSRASLNAEKSAFLAKLNKVQDNNIEVVPDFSSPRDELQNKPVLPINNSSKSELQIKSLAALSDDDEKMDERKEN